MIAKKLSQTEMLKIIDFSDPSLADEEVEQRLLTFCLNCPDPLKAMQVVLDAPRGASNADILEQALNLPTRSVASYPASELPLNHPLRHWRIG